jgi:zinc protease
MAAWMMNEGAGDMTSQDYLGRLDELGIRLSFESSSEAFSVSIKTLKENLGETIDLVNLALTEARFDPEPLQRARQSLLNDFQSQQRSPGARASQRLLTALWGDHPYAQRALTSAQAINAITAEDLHAFAERQFARDNVTIGVVGDITGDELGPMIDRLLDGLPAESDIPDVPAPSFTALESPQTVEARIPQSVIYGAQPGLTRDDADYYAAYLLNHILGGSGFESRLVQQVRVERGLAYSVGSSLAVWDRGGLLFVSAGTANERAGETVSVIRQAWATMAEEGPTRSELEAAKSNVIGSFTLRLTTSDSIARILVAMQENALGRDYIDRRGDIYQAITLEEVRRVAAEVLDPQALSFVIAGQPEGL